jgi:hypothetical protein
MEGCVFIESTRTMPSFETLMSTLIGTANAAARDFDLAKKREYLRGYSDGEAATRKELDALRQQLRAILGEAPRRVEEYRAERDDPALGPPARAPRGSVEPKVFGAIKDSVKGKKSSEIAGETGVPENSVRGTLNKLRKEGRVFRQGEVWRPSGPIAQKDGSTVQVTPDGMLVTTPASLTGNGSAHNPDAAKRALFDE